MTEQNTTEQSKTKQDRVRNLLRWITFPFRWLLNQVDMEGFTDWTRGYDVPFRWRWAIFWGILILSGSVPAIEAAILSNHWGVLVQLVMWPLMAVYQVYRGRKQAVILRERVGILRERAEMWQEQANSATQVAEGGMALIEEAQGKLDESVVYTQLLGSALEKALSINDEIMVDKRQLLSLLKHATEGIGDVVKELLAFEADGRISDSQLSTFAADVSALLKLHTVDDLIEIAEQFHADKLKAEEDRLKAIYMIELGAQQMESMQAEIVQLKEVKKLRSDPSSSFDPKRIGDELQKGRNQKILQLLCEGLSNPEIAERLGISEGTVKNRVSDLYDIFEVSFSLGTIKRREKLCEAAQAWLKKS